MVDKVVKSDAEWRQLSREQYEVTRHKGTERPFTGAYHAIKVPGTYVRVCCEQPLFDAASKCDSGTGWPSFYATGERYCMNSAALRLMPKQDRG